ncbi:EamA family transporter, partial [uncultured Acinetobacter sp.]|uniref:EamA family transporter n=1 Tax=uncultured Acinetobacter sp. TaxID=165433 RepID=UPI0025912F8D
MFKASSPDSNSSAMPLWIYSFPLIPVLIWAINMVVTKYAASVIEPVSISFWRMLIALIVMLPFVYSALYR